MSDVEEVIARLRDDPEAAAELASFKERFISLSSQEAESAPLLQALLERVEATVPGFRFSDAPDVVFDQLLALSVQMMGLMLPWWQSLPSAVAETGLIVPLSQMPPAEIGALLKAHRDDGPDASVAFVRHYYDRLFACPNFLPRLKLSWRADPMLGRRFAVLSDGLDAHAARLFSASVPVLLAQLEGLIADISSHEGRMKAIEWRTHLSDVASQDALSGQLMQQFVSDVLAATFEHGKAVTSPLSRHAILHGGDVGYGTETNSRTAILLVDYFAFVNRVRPAR
ncbi:MAG: hypothetical protein H6719_12365 [Sandaracinaceae bacterium]|nr:hypothetical protein [Sandaracinaceae bacterium]